MNTAGEVTAKGKTLIDNWLNAKQRIERLKRDLNTAECDYANTALALGKWLAPSDAKPGEKIAVWYGDSLFQTEITNGDPIITVRLRGKHFGES